MTALLYRFPTPSPPHSVDTRFTVRDRIDLAGWQRHSAVSRVIIDEGDPSAGPAGGAFALIYVDNAPWAQWGIGRSGRHITTWCCRTGADLDISPTMAKALTGLPVYRVAMAGRALRSRAVIAMEATATSASAITHRP